MSAHSSEEPAVYFAANSDAIKIGHSTQPFIRQLQLHPRARQLWMIGVLRGSADLERALHRKFDHLWLNLYGEREWFSPAPELIEFIDELEAAGDLIPWADYDRRMRRKNRLAQPPIYRKSAQLLRGHFPA